MRDHRFLTSLVSTTSVYQMNMLRHHNRGMKDKSLAVVMDGMTKNDIPRLRRKRLPIERAERSISRATTPAPHSPFDCERVFGLVQPELAAAGKNDGGGDSPTFFMNLGAGDVLGIEGGEGGLQVVAHEIEDSADQMPAAVELPPVIAGLGGMNAGFGRRQAEDQPAASGIHRAQVKDVAKEDTVGFGMIAVEEDVRADDHKRRLYFRERFMCRVPQGLKPAYLLALGGTAEEATEKVGCQVQNDHRG
jgi:hypothetical protein